jgi:hypothetical protein
MMPLYPTTCPHCGKSLSQPTVPSALGFPNGAPQAVAPGMAYPTGGFQAASYGFRGGVPFASGMDGRSGYAVTAEGMAAVAYYAAEQARLDALRRFGFPPGTAAGPAPRSRPSHLRLVRDDDDGG